MQLKAVCPFPVGAVLQMVNSTNPNTVFPGTTWQQMQGRVLIGSSNDYALGATGGAASHTLTTDELPSHTHSVGAHAHGLNSHTHSVGAHKHTVPAHGHGNNISYSVNSSGSVTNGITGGSHTHNIRAKNTNNNTVFQPIGSKATSQLASGGSYWGCAGDCWYIYAENSTHTHNLPNHTHTLSKSGGVSDKAAFDTNNSTAFDSGAASGNTANSTAFDSGSTGGGRRSQRCHLTRLSTCGSARRSGVTEVLERAA